MGRKEDGQLGIEGEEELWNGGGLQKGQITEGGRREKQFRERNQA